MCELIMSKSRFDVEAISMSFCSHTQTQGQKSLKLIKI